MALKLATLIIGSVVLIAASQNCSRQLRVQPEAPRITKHAVVNNFTHMKFISNNFGNAAIENQLTIDYDLVNNQVEIASDRVDGVRCTKSLTLNSSLTAMFQEAFQSMSYGPDFTSSHLFPGDSFMTLTNASGELDFVIDAEVAPANVARIKDPQNLYYMIQGLVFADDESTIQTCL